MARVHSEQTATSSDCAAGWTTGTLAKFKTMEGGTVEGMDCYSTCWEDFGVGEVPLKYRKDLVTFCSTCDSSPEACTLYGAGFVAVWLLLIYSSVFVCLSVCVFDPFKYFLLLST